MDDPATADPATAAGVRHALAGGTRWALTSEREVARELEARYPGLGRMMLAAYEFHRRAAAWAVTGSDLAKPAAGLIICGAGLPVPGPSLHARAAGISPAVRVAYVDAAARTGDVNAEFLARGSGGTVAVAVARSIDPAAVLRAPACAELLKAGPVSVHLVLCPSRWPPAKAPGAVSGYARLLPPGSTLCMSVVVPDRDPGGNLTPQAAEMTRDASLAGSPAYAYTAADVARWIDGAGMTLHPEGVRPARAFGRDWAQAYRAAPQVPGRVFEAVAIVR